ncbi:hypothetical protein [Streptomyces sp. NPDC057176]|uniref:hypothetical protein n=1 Tax=Streptomyces sp. NPDC057176 TaxID=3346036 RepID=UPI003633DFD3
MLNFEALNFEVLNFEALDIVPVRPEGRGTVAEFERAADEAEEREGAGGAAGGRRRGGGPGVRRAATRRAEMTGCRAVSYLTGFFPVMPR